MKNKKSDYTLWAQLAIVGILIFLVGYNLGGNSGVSGNAIISTQSASKIMPKGVPAIYGSEMGVSYDDVSASNPGLADSTISKLRMYEDSQLDSIQMARYISTVSEISCEYCCGAKSIIFENGKRACGCAHSFAMRGLAKYLLIEHPDMTDDDILSELGKWKVLFFPDIMQDKADILEANGIDSTDYINLASNKYRDIEKGQSSGGGMVGGC